MVPQKGRSFRLQVCSSLRNTARSFHAARGDGDERAEALIRMQVLVAEFISPPNVCTFSFIVGNIVPKSVKCIHSATERYANHTGNHA